MRKKKFKMKNLLLEKLTIIIFSYNRHNYLKRTLKYWSNYDIKLVVLDGSNAKLEDPILNNKNIKIFKKGRKEI